MTDSPLFLRKDEAGITTLTLNRPQSRNSLSFAMLNALRAEFVKGDLAYFGSSFEGGVDHGALDLFGVVEGGSVTAVKFRQDVAT